MASDSLVTAFDDQDPPRRELVDDCVHCGFCLTTCPTYVLWGHEADSPRGRIDLVRSGLEGGALTDTMVTHIDRCLGCMACVTACPSGVQYDRIVTATRGQLERRHKRGLQDRLLRGLIFATFPYPRRMRFPRFLLRLYRLSRLERLVHRWRLRRGCRDRSVPWNPSPHPRPGTRRCGRGTRRRVPGARLSGC